MIFELGFQIGQGCCGVEGVAYSNGHLAAVFQKQEMETDSFGEQATEGPKLAIFRCLVHERSFLCTTS